MAFEFHQQPLSQIRRGQATASEAPSSGTLDAAGSHLIFAAPTATDAELVALSRGTPEHPVFGCTTAGEIAAGYLEDHVVRVPFSSPLFSTSATLLEGVSTARPAEIYQATRELVASFRECGAEPGACGACQDKQCFAILLVDGLSMAEERLSNWVNGSLGGIPLLGASAGDGLAFERTRVFLNGRVASDAAVLALVHTRLDQSLFQAHHFEAGPSSLVVTAAEPQARRIQELDGEVAAVAYAEAIRVPVEDLGPDVFARHPFLIRIGTTAYVRAIRAVEPDGSLVLYCAIEVGLPLSIGIAGDLERNMADIAERAVRGFESIHMTLVFDCILRRLSVIAHGARDVFGQHLTSIKGVGFSAYGEQLSGKHVNYTVTGITLGRRHA